MRAIDVALTVVRRMHDMRITPTQGEALLLLADGKEEAIPACMNAGAARSVFDSLLRRGWIRTRPDGGFSLTAEGSRKTGNLLDFFRKQPIDKRHS